MKVGKPKSKRVPVRLRHKIQKASAAKQRKDRKLAKKNPEWRSKLKKDPGIPNLFPYKDKILHEIEESKRRKEEDQVKRREEARARRQQVISDGADETMAGVAEEEDEDALLDLEDDEEEDDEGDETMGDADANPMAALLASARARARDFSHRDAADDLASDNDSASADDDMSDSASNPDTATLLRDTSRKAFDKAFKDVIAESDVLLYVLDARDPPGTRSPATEAAITADPSKRLVLVLNKIDLVPAPVLAAWLTHLRRSFPTLPLRASSSAAPHAKTFDHKALTPASTAATLLKSLKAYAAKAGARRALAVGVIGYPNVGKSSVINALASRLGSRAAPAPTGAEAGVTTAKRAVKLDSKLTLLDSPGIVFPNAAAADAKAARADEQARLVLLNAVPPKDIDDPVPAVSLLLRRLGAAPAQLAALLDTYGVPALMTQAGADPTTDFLVQVARKRGRLGKGGVPNLHAAAQAVVTDWRDGRIQGWVEAPKEEVEVAKREGALGAGAADQKKVVAQWAEEFKIEGLWGDGVGEKA